MNKTLLLFCVCFYIIISKMWYNYFIIYLTKFKSNYNLHKFWQ